MAAVSPAAVKFSVDHIFLFFNRIVIEGWCDLDIKIERVVVGRKAGQPVRTFSVDQTCRIDRSDVARSKRLKNAENIKFGFIVSIPFDFPSEIDPYATEFEWTLLGRSESISCFKRLE